MIRLLLAALLSLLAVQALADPPIDKTVWKDGSSPSFDAPEGLCSWKKEQVRTGSNFQSVADNGSSFLNATMYVCRWKATFDGQSWLTNEQAYVGQTVKVCQDGSQPDTTKPLAEQCASACPPAGTVMGNTTWTINWATGPESNSPNIGPSYTPFGKNFCANGCTISPKDVSDCRVETDPSTNGYYRVYCVYTYQSEGMSCSASGNPPAAGSGGPSAPSTPNPGKNSCPAGTSAGGIDSSGIPICIGKPKDSTGESNNTQNKTTSPPTTTTGADGTKTTTQTTTQTNGDGSTTTTTTTTVEKPDGTKSTSTQTTTSKAADGSDGKKDVSPEQKDLCQRQPHLNICNNSNVAGSCGSISCTGDAITCALLRTQAERNCRDKQAEDELKAKPYNNLGNAVLSGADPMAATLPTKANAAQINIPSLDQSGWLGGGSCFPDKTFSVQGHSFTIPFSAACAYLVAFRYALMLVALFASFRMISGAILKD